MAIFKKCFVGEIVEKDIRLDSYFCLSKDLIFTFQFFPVCFLGCLGCTIACWSPTTTVSIWSKYYIIYFQIIHF